MSSAFSGLRAQPLPLNGSVRDKSGKAIAGALILSSDNDSLIYTDSNGDFHLLPTGQKHFIKVLAPGYVPKRIVLPFNFNEKLLISLDNIDFTSSFNAHEIVRQASLHRLQNKHLYTAYHAKAYKKNVAYLQKVPFNIWPFSGIYLPSKKDTGIVYFSEQEVNRNFTDNYHFQDSITAFNAAGNLPLSDFGNVADKDLSLYHPQIFLPQFSFRRYHSPLSKRGRAFYDFSAIGIYKDGEHKVYRIGFSPHHKGTATLSGYFDIYDQTFTLASTSFKMQPSNHLELLDSIRVQQFYFYDREQYKQATQKVKFYLRITGFKGWYETDCAYMQHQFINDTLANAQNEVATLDSSVVTGDEEFWVKKRNLVLLPNEQKILNEESLNNLFREQYSRIEGLQTPLQPVKLLYTRYIYRKDDFYFDFAPVYYALGYNTVEGVYLRYQLPIRLYGKDHEWLLQPDVKMGFGDGNFKSRIKAEFTYDLRNPKIVSFEAGHVYDQFNDNVPISPLLNSFYSLFIGRNYLKLYGKDFAKMGYHLEIINGLELQSSLELASRFAVYNTTDFTITGDPDKFTANNPTSAGVISGARGFNDHQALTFRAEVAYQFFQQYKTINGKKINLKMNTPRLDIMYRQGIPSAFSVTNYSFLEGGISFNTSLGNLGYTQWDISAGGFFNKHRIEFVDYKHFNGTQTFYLQPAPAYGSSIKQFSTLGYYNYSTQRGFMEGHLEHHFDGFLVSRMGFTRKLKLHAFTGANYLNNFTEQQFLEFFFGFDNIFNIMRIEVAGGLDNFKDFTPTLLIGIDFNYLYYGNNHQ